MKQIQNDRSVLVQGGDNQLQKNDSKLATQ